MGIEALTMAEYIDRNTAIAKVTALEVIEPLSTMVDVKRLLADIPAADVAPVRHGRWISVPHKLARVCSVCNRDEPYKFADIDADVYDYCPSCGAKMDGGTGNGC